MKRRSDGRWQKRIKLPNGKSKLIYSTAKTEKTAIQDFNAQMLQLNSEKEKFVLLETIIEQWESAHFPEISYNTACKYSVCLKKIKAYFSNVQITKITPPDVDLFLKDLKKKGYAKDTVSINKSVLSQIFDFAIYNRIITTNPCSVVTVPKGLRQERREAATPEEVKVVLQSVDKHFGLYAFMAVLTGMRREELLALTDRDFDFDKKEITVDKAVVFKHNQPEIKDTKTETSKRRIYLPDAIVPYVFDKKGYIFGNGDKPMSLTAFRRAYDRYRRETGLSVTSHQLRHSYATMLYDAEIDVKTAQQQLGHSKASTTQDIYTHIWKKRQSEQMLKMEEYIKQIL